MDYYVTCPDHVTVSTFIPSDDSITAQELSTLGLDRLKSALVALGLKCGGTLQERAERLFLTKGRKLTELNPSLFAKNKPGSKDGKRAPEKMKEIAKIEVETDILIEMKIFE